MKILVIVAPLATAWVEPNNLLEFCREMEPRLTQESELKKRSTEDPLHVATFDHVVATLPQPKDSRGASPTSNRDPAPSLHTPLAT